ncbi:MAG: hypothetical protein NC548_55165 [Lachnospiraceae bacterium]|nr:hypothetical protein [Lachnospiraceae bacterium]
MLYGDGITNLLKDASTAFADIESTLLILAVVMLALAIAVIIWKNTKR